MTEKQGQRCINCKWWVKDHGLFKDWKPETKNPKADWGECTCPLPEFILDEINYKRGRYECLTPAEAGEDCFVWTAKEEPKP